MISNKMTPRRRGVILQLEVTSAEVYRLAVTFAVKGTRLDSVEVGCYEFQRGAGLLLYAC